MFNYKQGRVEARRIVSIRGVNISSGVQDGEASIVCEQALRGALVAGQEKEGQLATMSLEFEYISALKKLMRNADWQR